ncbi:MAG: hypothetical protein WBB67_06530 [bacterium]
MKKNNNRRNISKGDISKIREKIFSCKTNFHKDQARLPFAEKIKVLMKLQKLAQNIKHTDLFIWKI